MVHELEIKKNTDAGHSISLSNRIKDLTLMLEEKDRQLEQKENNYDNIKLLFDAEKKEHERTSKDFHGSLEENSRLHKTIEDQVKQLNQLYSESRDFGVKTSEIKAESAVI